MNEEMKIAFRGAFEEHATDLTIFMNGVEEYFSSHRSIRPNGTSVIHSTKKRIKDFDHLCEKISRKNAKRREENKDEITPDNLFSEITDLAGVRILLLFQNNFPVIDGSIRRKLHSGDWTLHERAKAFTWDPETIQFFENFELDVSQRDTFYTSVHYLIKPRPDSPICCELQVRTLFEEIWGEVDHMLNYPTPTTMLACKEQLMVLSKIAGAGSRLVDSIQRTINT